MATISWVFFDHHKKEDGSINVKIRVTHNRKTRYLPTSEYIFPDEVSRGGKIKGKAKIDKLNDLVNLTYKKIESLPVNLMDIDEIVRIVSVKNTEVSFSFFKYIEKMATSMDEKGQAGTAYNYRCTLRSLKRFRDDELYFNEITVGFLKEYEKHLRDNKTGPRGLSLYMGLIRATFNQAIREFNNYSAGIVNIVSPFDHSSYVIPKEPRPEQRSIPAGSIALLRDLPNLSGRMEQAQDMFLLSFYLIGMNAIDLYNCKEMKDGRITYNRTKTMTRREDKAVFSVRVPAVAAPLIEKYKDVTGERLFMFHRQYATANNFSHALRFGLSNIEKTQINKKDAPVKKFLSSVIGHLEFYAARHSWATIARNDCSIDKYTIHECLNHVDDRMRVTDLYIRRDWSTIDQANEKVLELLSNIKTDLSAIFE